MIWELRRVLENVKKKLTKVSPLPEEDGEIDFHFLSNLERMEVGKISVLSQKLLAVFAEDLHHGDPAMALEDLAAMLLQWAAHIRIERQKRQESVIPSCTIGSRLKVRVPDHFPIFIAEVIREDTLWIPVLNQEYQLEQVQIIPEQPVQQPQPVGAVVLQEELYKNLIDIQQASKQRDASLLALPRRK